MMIIMIHPEAWNVSNIFLTILGSVGLNQNHFVVTYMPESHLRAKNPFFSSHLRLGVCVNSNALMSKVID